MKKIFTLLFLFGFLLANSQKMMIDPNGLKQGQWQDWYDDGSIKYNGTFMDGIEQGLWKFYYKTGELKATKEFFHEGKAAATHIYYKNGNIRASGLYVNKMKDSTWNYFNEDSVLGESIKFKSSKRFWTLFCKFEG